MQTSPPVLDRKAGLMVMPGDNLMLSDGHNPGGRTPIRLICMTAERLRDHELWD
jgi:hypothetical protein